MKRCLLLLLLLLSAGPVLAQSLDSVDAALTGLDRQRATLIQEYDRLRKQNDERQKRIEGGAAASADVKQAYASAARLEEINARLNELGANRQALCNQWRALYLGEVETLLASAEKEPDAKKKAEAGRRLQHLQARNAELCAESVPSDSLQWRSLQIETYDGPQEIQQKAQLLKDIQRETTLRIAKLDDRYRQTQKEKRTRERAQEFILEGTLFDQNVSIRAPGNTGGATPAAFGVNPTREFKGDAVNSASPENTAASTDLGTSWQSYESPKQAEDEYHRQRDGLLQQQKELEIKIRTFEEKARSLLHP